MPAHLTNGTGFGFMATPTAKANRACPSMQKHPGVRRIMGLKPTHSVPTPHGFSEDGRSNGPSGNELGRAVNRLLPTPTTQDAKNNGGPSQRERNTPPLNAVAGGSLNPAWVAWLMGWPVNWESLEPLATMDGMGDWSEEPNGVPRVAKGVPDRVNRLKALGNGQVPQCVAAAWRVLTQ